MCTGNDRWTCKAIADTNDMFSVIRASRVGTCCDASLGPREIGLSALLLAAALICLLSPPKRYLFCVRTGLKRHSAIQRKARAKRRWGKQLSAAPSVAYARKL